MLAGLPAHLAQHLIGEIDGFLVGDRCDGVVPAVQIAANRNHREDLDDLDIGEMLPHLDEILGLGHVRRDTCRHRQPEGGPLGIGEQIRCLETPQRLDLFVRHTDLVKVIGAMRLAMPAPAGQAGNGENKLFQLS